MKRLTSVLLAFALMLSMGSTVFAQEGDAFQNESDSTETVSPQPIIEQIYGETVRKLENQNSQVIVNHKVESPMKGCLT